jgi:hypothetical protein
VKTDSLRTLDSLLRQTVTILPINEKEVESEQEGRRKGKKRDVRRAMWTSSCCSAPATQLYCAIATVCPPSLRTSYYARSRWRKKLFESSSRPLRRCLFSSSMPSSALRTKQYYAVLLVHDREVPPASYSVSLAPDAVPLLRLLFTRQCAPENAVPRPRPGTQVKLPSELA